MKKLLYLFLTVLIVGCSDDAKKNDLTVLNLNGNVKSITYTTFEAIEKFGEITNGKMGYSSSSIFNNNGNEIEGNYYGADGSLENKNIYKYDDKGNEIEINYYKADDKTGGRSTLEYDNDNDNRGNWVRVVFYSDYFDNIEPLIWITERKIEYYKP